MMEVLRNRSGDDFNSLDLLHGLFRRRANPFEAVLCRGRRAKNQSLHRQNHTQLGWCSYICNQHLHPLLSTFPQLSTASPLAPSRHHGACAGFPGWLLSPTPHHKEDGGQPPACPCGPTTEHRGDAALQLPSREETGLCGDTWHQVRAGLMPCCPRAPAKA